MIRYIGSICIFIFAFYVIFSYEKYQKQKIYHSKMFLDFLKFLENEMRGLGRPLRACIKDFASQRRLCAPFFSSLEAGAVPGEAYRTVHAQLPVSPEMDQLLSEAFDSFVGGRDAVRRSIGDARVRCEGLVDAEQAEQLRRFRLFRTLTAASAMGLVILLL